MLENEGLEPVESGAIESPSPEAASTPEVNPTPAEHVASEANKPDTQTPFHEHPRFKELVEQKNQFAEQMKALQAHNAEMQKRLESFAKPAVEKPVDPMIERLKGVDPEFAKYMEKLAGSQDELKQLRDWRQQVESDRIRTEAVNTVTRLHTENKVPENLRALYNSQIEALVQKTPGARMEDIPKMFKQVHDQYTQILEGVKRAEREAYGKGKKADSSIPAPGKGKPVAPSGKFEWSKNPEEARAQMVQRIIKMSKASNDI